jgi:hypothetical protein
MSRPEFTDSIAADPAEIARFLALPDPAFFDYEYRRFRPEQSVFIQARQDGKLVGTQALVPYPLRIDGRPIMSGRSERTMVDPALRGAGMFPKLMDACARRAVEKNLQLIWGTTTAKVPFQRNGFLFFAGFYEHAFLCVAPARVAADVAREQPRNLRAAKLAATLPSLALRGASVLARTRQLEIVSQPKRDSDIDELYDILRGDAPLVTMQHDPQFLSWVLDEGVRQVTRYHAYDGDALVAYAFIDVTAGSTATLVDFAARDRASLHALMRAVRHDLAAGGTAYLHARYNVLNPLLARQRRWLIGAGFVPVYRGGGFVVRPLAFQDLNYLNDLSRWYITELWFQLYPQTVA